MCRRICSIQAISRSRRTATRSRVESTASSATSRNGIDGRSGDRRFDHVKRRVSMNNDIGQSSGRAFDPADTGVVMIDPQNDVLSEKGAAWAAVGQSVKDKKTVENMERLQTAKQN